MNGHYILSEKGEPVPCEDTIQWGKWFQTANRKVDSTEIDNSRISTVFLGLDHSFGSGAPILYETMVFGGELDGYTDRYETKEAAIKGHRATVAKVEATLQ